MGRPPTWRSIAFSAAGFLQSKRAQASNAAPTRVFQQSESTYRLVKQASPLYKNPPGMPSKTGRLPGGIDLWFVLMHGSFRPHQRYFRRVGTRMFISIGLAIWSFIPASSATCLSSEKAFAVIAMMGISAFWASSSLRIFLAAS